MNELDLRSLRLRQKYLLRFAGFLLASITVVFLLFGIAINSSRKVTKEHPEITMHAAENIALTKEPGKLLSSELENEDGKLVYSFDIDHSGVIHEVSVDAETGKMVADTVEDPSEEFTNGGNKERPQHY